MLINFNEISEIAVKGMNGGFGEIKARIFADDQGKIIPSRICAGGSIGLHTHKTSDDINYVLSGQGKAITDGKEEILKAGCCHICKKGSEHSIINTGSDDLVLITIVVER